MKKQMTAVGLSILLLVTVLPLTALAGTRNLWPSQFTPISSDSPGSSNSLADALAKAKSGFSYLSANGDNFIMYESEVQLPVGTTIRGFAVNAYVHSAASVRAYLLCKKLGGPTNIVSEIEIYADAEGWHQAPSIDSGSAKVAAGFKYWVQLHIFQDAARVEGVQVSYR